RKISEESAELQAGGVQVVPQVGCRPLEVRFDFTEPAFYLEQSPFWRPVMAKSRDERRRLFAEAEFRAELGRQTGFVAALAQGWDRLVLRLAASEGVRRWQDRSVAEIAAAEGRAPLDAFCDLVLEDDLATQWGAVLMNHDERAVAELIRHPAGLLALSDAGAHVDTLCDQGFTTYLLGHWVRELRALALEEAVRLVTSVPAERYGLHGRPRLRGAMRTEAEAREQSIQSTNELFAMGLLTPTGGNVSARAADPELYWITPSRMYKGGLKQEDLVCIKPDGTVCEGTKQPSVE